MNLLFYMTRFPGYGGIESVTEIVGNQLIDSGIEITILTHSTQNFDSKLLKRVKLYVMPNLESYYNNENLHFAESLVENNQFDAIIYQDSYAPSEKIVCKLADKFRIPLYVFEHNTPMYVINSQRHDCTLTLKEIFRRVYWHPRQLNLVRKRKKLLLDSCEKYVLLSKTFINDLADIMNGRFNRDKVIYINNPIIYAPINEQNLKKKENIVLFMGRLEEQKRVYLMLDIWKHIQPVGWKFFIVGDGSHRTMLEEKVKNESITNIEFVGYTNNPMQWYEKSKILWMTSDFEGWGMTLVEAMQKGCVPVVYNTFSSLKDVIPTSEIGFVVDNMDEKQFSKMTQLLMKDDTLRINMAIKGIEYVKQYDISKIVGEWGNLLNYKEL